MSQALALAAAEHIRYRGGRGRFCFGIVLADETGQRGRDLRLRYPTDLGPLSQCRGMRSHDRDPYVLGPRLFDAVFLPLHRPAAAAVIAGDDERGFVAILRPGLQRVPEFLNEAIEVVG